MPLAKSTIELAIGGLLLGAAIAGCSCVHDVPWRVHLNGTAGGASAVTLRVRRNTCVTGAIEHEVTLDAHMPAATEAALPALPRGPHCFEVTVLDATCEVIGEAATVVQLPTDGADVVSEVQPRDRPSSPICEATMCSRGRCGMDAGALPDGGADANADLGIRDGGEGPDIGADARDSMPPPIDVGTPDAPSDVGHDAPASDTGFDGGDELVIECESGMTHGTMIRMSDATSSGGMYVAVPYPGAYDNAFADPYPPPNRVDLPVVLPAGGTWYVEVRSESTTSTETTLFAAFSSQSGSMRTFDAPSTAWAWASGVQLRFDSLAAGSDVLVIAAGNAGVACDRIVISRSPSLDAGP